ncbi:MAG: hypothetical protein AAGA26_06425 [Pseudomonadota bacterium]
MTSKNKINANELDETTLDEISGGPHFRNFHGAAFDFQNGGDTVLATKGPVGGEAAFEVCDPLLRRIAN